MKRNSCDSSFDEKLAEFLVGLSLPQKAWPLQLADLTPIGNIGFYCETIEHSLGFVEAV